MHNTMQKLKCSFSYFRQNFVTYESLLLYWSWYLIENWSNIINIILRRVFSWLYCFKLPFIQRWYPLICKLLLVLIKQGWIVCIRVIVIYCQSLTFHSCQYFAMLMCFFFLSVINLLLSVSTVQICVYFMV